MKKVPRYLYTGGIVLSLVIAFGLWKPLAKADHDDEDRQVPKFRVDPFWPKPLPAPVGNDGVAHRWVAGEIAASCTDANDNVFTFNRAWEVGATAIVNGVSVTQGAESGAIVAQDAAASAVPSPPVLAYDSEGNVVAHWGDPTIVTSGKPGDAGFGGSAVLPHGAHGCFVDYQGNVWLAGNGDGIVQKYSHDGRLLAQIGQKGICDGPSNNSAISGASVYPTCGEAHDFNSSTTLLNEPPDMAVDPNADPVTHNRGNVYIADGYGNHRVVVFGTTDGVHYTFVRQFGSNCGRNSPDCPNGTFGATGGGHPHCIVLGNDNLVYTCDRPNSRIEVFDRLGNWRRTIPISKFPTASPANLKAILLAGTRACDITFYPNLDFLATQSPTSQKFIVDVDLGNDNTWLIDHATGVTLGAFGRCGLAPCPGHNVGEFAFGHTTATDSKGNVYIAETITGRRIQKFVRVRHEKDEDDHPDDR